MSENENYEPICSKCKSFRHGVETYCALTWRDPVFGHRLHSRDCKDVRANEFMCGAEGRGFCPKDTDFAEVSSTGVALKATVAETEILKRIIADLASVVGVGTYRVIGGTLHVSSASQSEPVKAERGWYLRDCDGFTISFVPLGASTVKPKGNEHAPKDHQSGC